MASSKRPKNPAVSVRAEVYAKLKVEAKQRGISVAALLAEILAKAGMVPDEGDK